MSKDSPRVVLLGGEGIGPEVVEATAHVLQQLVPRIEFIRPSHGEPAMKEHGSAMPPASQEACRSADGILFGATWKHTAPVLRFLRWGLDTYANLRPSKTRPGIPSPLKKDAPIDILVVRENIEGEYPSREGELSDFAARWPDFKDALGRSLPASGGAFALRVTTEAGSRRVSEVAARQAQRRARAGRPGKVTIVTKQNVLKKTDGIFKDVAEQVLNAAGVPFDHYYVDDACRRLVFQPEKIDVILTSNLFGDIMSDITAELVGGLGVAPSGCIGEKYSYFESVHGSAPDIAGKGIANPVATVLSAQMLLEHLGLDVQATALDRAVDRLLTERKVLTPDLGGSASTTDVAQALVSLAT